MPNSVPSAGEGQGTHDMTDRVSDDLLRETLTNGFQLDASPAVKEIIRELLELREVVRNADAVAKADAALYDAIEAWRSEPPKARCALSPVTLAEAIEYAWRECRYARNKPGSDVVPTIETYRAANEST